MRGYVESTWGVWNADEARAQITEDITRGRLRIVDVNNRAAGMTRVDKHPTHIDINQVFILPEHQGQGVGTKLIEDVLLLSRQLGVPVRLWVLRVNPAQRLYERLGFRVFEETDASLHLQSGA